MKLGVGSLVTLNEKKSIGKRFSDSNLVKFYNLHKYPTLCTISYCVVSDIKRMQEPKESSKATHKIVVSACNNHSVKDIFIEDDLTVLPFRIEDSRIPTEGIVISTNNILEIKVSTSTSFFIKEGFKINFTDPRNSSLIKEKICYGYVKELDLFILESENIKGSSLLNGIFIPVRLIPSKKSLSHKEIENLLGYEFTYAG